MDGISAAASVFAVVSLAIQLAEKANELYRFWQSIDEAPDSIRAIVSDLKLLSAVLDQISKRDRQHGPDITTTGVIESCMYLCSIVIIRASIHKRME
jgi:hypothetical protein